MPAHATHPSALAQAIGLLVALAVTFLAATAGAIASVDASTFYSELARPGWAPPGWLFGPGWSVLYTLMAVAAWLVWRKAGLPRATAALSLFALQLLANALWSWLFFAWRIGALALVDVLVLWVLVAATEKSSLRYRGRSSPLSQTRSPFATPCTEKAHLPSQRR